MSPTQEPKAAKRHSRITEARLAIRHAQRYLDRYPAATAAPVVRDIKLALLGLLDEVEG